jgi:hypothetical protein
LKFKLKLIDVKGGLWVAQTALLLFTIRLPIGT